jgi:methylated-DNA-protein-cysteine methyltransferase-like protein
VTTDEYRAAVIAVVRSIPRGRVMSYGAIADYLAEVSGRRSSRLVGHVLARTNEDVPWQRVVRHDGSPARDHLPRALRLLRDDGAPLIRERVDMQAAAWSPPLDPARFITGALQRRRSVAPL